MKRVILTLAAVAALALAGPAGDLKVTGPTAAEPYKLVRLSATGAEPGTVYFWDVSPDDGTVDVDERDGQLVCVAPPGRYTVRLRAVWHDAGKLKGQTARHAFTIGTPTPPAPPPSPAPIGAEGNRVLIVYESEAERSLPPGQLAVLFGRKFRDYLDAKCVKGPGGEPERRIYDKDVKTAGETKVWQDAMARPRQSVPWIVISNGRTGFEGPLPADPEEAIALCDKYLK